MREQLYKIFDLLLNTSKNDKTIGFCFWFFGIVFFLIHFIFGKDCDPLLIIIPAIPTLFFIVWFILALIVLSIEKLIIAIEFVVYKLGIPKIIINVNVIWKYQQKKS